MRELDVRCGEQYFVNVTLFVLYEFRAKLLAVNQWFLLIVLCLSLNGRIELLLEILKILPSANSAALVGAYILEGKHCTFIAINNSPRNDHLGSFVFHFLSLRGKILNAIRSFYFNILFSVC